MLTENDIVFVEATVRRYRDKEMTGPWTTWRIGINLEKISLLWSAPTGTSVEPESEDDSFLDTDFEF